MAFLEREGMERHLSGIEMEIHPGWLLFYFDSPLSEAKFKRRETLTKRTYGRKAAYSQAIVSREGAFSFSSLALGWWHMHQYFGVWDYSR